MTSLNLFTTRFDQVRLYFNLLYFYKYCYMYNEVHEFLLFAHIR